MRISVYLQDQPLSSNAPHKASRLFAAMLLANCEARPIGQNEIQLTTGESWKELKNRYRSVPRSEVETGLLPPLDFYFPWVGLPEWLLRCYRTHEFAA